ncbi:hypothetical protein MTR67_015217 [Solanum verrucosum]|uniref:Uncharacterized protein n=1 Tax=Solanum verrucosum TaxID=315347 RepID=A0AAF0TII7_SOLVR|nr:hypothetical protein MTR67_015217 [Solanum verrucosum]
MASFDIPTIDVSPFFSSEENEEGKKKATEQMKEACVNYGFFQIANHKIPLELLSRTMDMYKTFFASSDEEKLLLQKTTTRENLHTKILEVHKDDQWIPIAPSKDKLVVNIGDVIQVLSNNRFKSATHRVVRPREANRYSCTFFYNVQEDKWVEPLPQFTEEIGESPKYRGFLFGEYIQLRIKNRTHPPARPQDLIHITHYSISM